MTEHSAVRRVASRPMRVMAETIAELRARGQHELADALSRQRDAWARTVATARHEHVLTRAQKAAAKRFAAMLDDAAKSKCDLQLAVFHTCQKQPVALRAFESGFQPTPWTCPGCGARVDDAELTYDLQAAPHSGAAA